MTKEDFQHIGKVYESRHVGQYINKIVEENEKLIGDRPDDGTNGQEGNWRTVERSGPTSSNGQYRAKSGNMETPWHALGAVKLIESCKGRESPDNRL